jgi:predicted nucleic-acid-binding Zn-ribbon protein
MTFTDDQRTTVQQWLDAQWSGKARCPAGHDSSWGVEENMAFVPGFALGEGGPKIVHEKGFGFVVLTCAECGYAAFLDTKVIGIR